MSAVTLRVFRWTPGEPERAQVYRVEAGASTTVLDCLVDVQRTQDPSLAFRYACRVGMCGSCAMVINGRERWACRTLVPSLGADTISIRPLYHFPLIRDLVVDMAPFVTKMRGVGSALIARPREVESAGSVGSPSALSPRTEGQRPADSAPSLCSGRRRKSGWSSRPASPVEPEYAALAGDSRQRREIDQAIECIGCGMCVSACTMVAHDARFPGPAALNRAFTLQWDHRDSGQAARWAVLLSEDGLARCHGQANCTEVCPMELEPSTSIIRLRRRAVRRLLRLSS
jgi:fumarate reductase iron-sulfur subunit